MSDDGRMSASILVIFQSQHKTSSAEGCENWLIIIIKTALLKNEEVQNHAKAKVKHIYIQIGLKHWQCINATSGQANDRLNLKCHQSQ